MSAGLLLGPALLVVAALGALAAPDLEGRDRYFGVPVNPGFPDSAEGQRIRQRYQWTIAAWTAVAMLAAWFGRFDVWHGAIGPLMLVLSYASIAYRSARRDVVPHAGPPEVAAAMGVDALQAVAEHPLPLPGGWLGQLGPFAVLAATAQWVVNRGVRDFPFNSFLVVGTLAAGILWSRARELARGTRHSLPPAVRPTDAARRAALWFLLCAGYCAPLVLAAWLLADHSVRFLGSALDVFYLCLVWLGVRTVVSTCVGEYDPLVRREGVRVVIGPFTATLLGFTWRGTDTARRGE
jgi:hypothetical protein